MGKEQKIHKSKFRKQLHEFLENSAKEIIETKEAGSIIIKHIKGNKLTPEEKILIRIQTYDVLKSIGIIVPFVFIPGASILITAIVTVANKKGINILPSSFSNQKEKITNNNIIKMEPTKEISRERISSGFLKLDKITYQRGEKKILREVISRGDSVAASLYNTSTKKFIFVKQFRPGVGADLIEIIAGTMDIEGETPQKCLEREVLEETGYIMSSCKLICSAYSSPGGSTEKIHIFNAITDGQKSGDGGGVGDEGIEIIEYSLQELYQNLDILSSDLKTAMAFAATIV